MTLAFSDHKFIWTIKMSSSLLLLLFPLNMNRQMYFIFRSVCFKPKFMLKAEKLNTDFLLQNLNLASFFLSLSSFPFLGFKKKKKTKKSVLERKNEKQTLKDAFATVSRLLLCKQDHGEQTLWPMPEQKHSQWLARHPEPIKTPFALTNLRHDWCAWSEILNELESTNLLPITISLGANLSGYKFAPVTIYFPFQFVWVQICCMILFYGPSLASFS